MYEPPRTTRGSAGAASPPPSAASTDRAVARSPTHSATFPARSSAPHGAGTGRPRADRRGPSDARPNTARVGSRAARRPRARARPSPPLAARLPLAPRSGAVPAGPGAERSGVVPRDVGDGDVVLTRRDAAAAARSSAADGRSPPRTRRTVGVRDRRPADAGTASHATRCAGLSSASGGVLARPGRCPSRTAPAGTRHHSMPGCASARDHRQDDTGRTVGVDVDRLLGDDLMRVPPHRLARVRVHVEPGPVRRRDVDADPVARRRRGCSSPRARS